SSDIYEHTPSLELVDEPYYPFASLEEREAFHAARQDGSIASFDDWEAFKAAMQNSNYQFPFHMSSLVAYPDRFLVSGRRVDFGRCVVSLVHKVSDARLWWKPGQRIRIAVDFSFPVLYGKVKLHKGHDPSGCSTRRPCGLE